MPEVTKESGCSAANLMPVFRPLKYYRPRGHPSPPFVCSQHNCKIKWFTSQHTQVIAKDKTPTHNQKSQPNSTQTKPEIGSGNHNNVPTGKELSEKVFSRILPEHFKLLLNCFSYLYFVGYAFKKEA